MDLRIREFEEADRPALRDIYLASRRAAFPWLPPGALNSEDFDRDTQQERVIVADLSDAPIGFASIWEADNFLHHLFVHPDFFRRGAGAALLRYCMHCFHGPAALKCLKDNAPAIAFYLALGWRIRGEGDSSDGPYYRMEIDSLAEPSGKPPKSSADGQT